MKQVTAPLAKKLPHQLNYHSEASNDNYYWLREKENPEVIKYLEDENAYTEQVMEHTKELRENIYEEMVARIQETDLSVPTKKGDYYYYSRTEKGKDYSIYCRKKNSLENEEEIILDCNQLAKGKKYFNLNAFKINTNQQLLAYSVDFTGSEEYSIYVKNLETGELLEDTIEDTAGNIVWANDNATFFYSTLDKTHRPYRLYRHELGNKKESDTLVFEELDGGYFLHAYKTKSSAYVMINLGSKVTTEIHYLDANTPKAAFQCFAPRRKKEEYKVAHHGDHFYILNNHEALNFKLMRTKTSNTKRENWEVVIAHDDKTLLSDLESFENNLVIYGRKNGMKSISIINHKTGDKHEVVFPEPVYTFWDQTNPEYKTTKLRFIYSSLITPRTVYDYEMDKREFENLKEYKVKGGYDKEAYTMERLFATAKDGTQIPISIAYKKDMKKDGNNPCYLYGYGSYGHSIDPYFSSARLSLLERGFVFAMAHIRGGSELGRTWYEAGKFLNKKNTFTDFVAAAEHMVASKFTNTDKLCISGGSAGGLLMGAVVNLRPELFKVAVYNVPFVDVINTMMDETIPLTVVEYDEWGNPNEKPFFDYMKSYCPYSNLAAVNYPNILITAGLNDPRVQYWEPAKYTAKLRELKLDKNRLLLKTNMGAGHGGASGRYEALKELAFDYTFLLDCLGMTK